MIVYPDIQHMNNSLVIHSTMSPATRAAPPWHTSRQHPVRVIQTTIEKSAGRPDHFLVDQ
jgi:hypothetical protein